MKIIDIKSEIESHQIEKFKQIMKLDGIMPSEIARSLNIDDNIHNIF